jgi:hypothetical protein
VKFYHISTILASSFYAVSAGIDHGAKAKTKRRKNSAQHNIHGDIKKYGTTRDMKKK